MSADHGYYLYTKGCRCDVCRAAKAAYMRERRAKAWELGRRYSDPLKPGAPASTPGVKRHYVPGIKHGTYFGYQERGCRCALCTAATTEKRLAEKARQDARKGAS